MTGTLALHPDVKYSWDSKPFKELVESDRWSVCKPVFFWLYPMRCITRTSIWNTLALNNTWNRFFIETKGSIYSFLSFLSVSLPNLSSRHYLRLKWKFQFTCPHLSRTVGRGCSNNHSAMQKRWADLWVLLWRAKAIYCTDLIWDPTEPRGWPSFPVLIEKTATVPVNMAVMAIFPDPGAPEEIPLITWAKWIPV